MGAAAVAAAVLVALAVAVSGAGAVRGTGASPAATAHPGAARADLSAFAGFGAWLDVFDTDLRRAAATTASRLRAAGVGTVFLETSKFDRTYDVQAPDVTGAFLDAAHAAGLKVVAWYLPGFVNLSLDVRRSLAAVGFRSATGGAFDGFALDIESTQLANVPLRTQRLLALVARVRAAAPRPYPLGGIVAAPVAVLLRPSYWPAFPWQQLAASVDAWLPMAYSTYHALGSDGTFGWTVANVALLRALVGDDRVPVHVVGGVASSLKPLDVDGFVRGAQQQHVLGASLYDVGTTRAALWPRLAPLALLRGA